MMQDRFPTERTTDHAFRNVLDRETGKLLEDTGGRQKLFPAAHANEVAEELNHSHRGQRTDPVGVADLVNAGSRIVGYDVHCNGFCVRVWTG
jgi:hypothetical protein